MIDAKDLRLNNYVTIDNKESWPKVSGLPMQVISISQRADEDFPNSNASITLQYKNDLFNQFNEFISPINLTEEILIKAGLDKDWLPDFSKEIDCSILQNGKVYAFKRGGRIIRYVHELQNLWKENTGEELTINL